MKHELYKCNYVACHHAVINGNYKTLSNNDIEDELTNFYVWKSIFFLKKSLEAGSINQFCF